MQECICLLCLNLTERVTVWKEMLINMKKKKTQKKKGVKVVIKVLLVLLVLMLGAVFLFINSKLNKLVDKDQQKEKKDIEISDAVTDSMEDDYITIALFGLDARAGDDMTKSGTAHSDAVIIASIDKKTKDVRLASVYRDCFVEIASEGQGTQKFTHAYMIGGPKCAVETLNKNLDLNIKDYVAVNFEALTKAIDALGGVEINVKSNELENLNKNLQEQIEVTGIASDGVWQSGKQVLNGAQATAYARIRKVGNGDFERTQRQRAVIKAMVKKAKESDFSTINDAINEVLPLVATNLTKGQILSLGKDVLSYDLDENEGFPLSNTTPTLGSKGSVVVPANLYSNVKHLHSFLYPNDDEYTVSDEVQRISDAISNETGVGDMFTDDTKEAKTQTNSDE